MARGNNGNRGRGGPHPGFSPRGGFDGGRGGGGRGRGRGQRGGGRGRGRGAFDSDAYSDALDFSVNWQDHATPSSPFAFRGRGRGRGRGDRPGTPGRGGGSARGGFSPRGAYSPRGRGRGLEPGVPDRAQEAAYVRRLGAKLGAGAPLSRVLYEDRPFLRPVIFVRSVHTATLFEEEEDIFQAVVEDVGDDEAAHVPTADRVARLFGVPQAEPGSGGDDDGDQDDEGQLEEFDFADLAEIQAQVDAAAAAAPAPPKTAVDEVGDKFTGFFIDTKPDRPAQASATLVAETMANVVLDGTPTTFDVEMTTSATFAVEEVVGISSVSGSSALVTTAPSMPTPVDSAMHEPPPLDSFFIDTTPGTTAPPSGRVAPTPMSRRPFSVESLLGSTRPSTPRNIAAEVQLEGTSPDDEIIVYEAPRPRAGRAAASPALPAPAPLPPTSHLNGTTHAYGVPVSEVVPAVSNPLTRSILTGTTQSYAPSVPVPASDAPPPTVVQPAVEAAATTAAPAPASNLLTRSILTGTTKPYEQSTPAQASDTTETAIAETVPMLSPAVPAPMPAIPPAPAFSSINFSVLSNTPPRRLAPRQPPSNLVASLAARARARGRKQQAPRRAVFGALGAAALERAEAELRGPDPREAHRRRGDSDVDWGDSSADDEAGPLGDEGMAVDSDLDPAAMAAFVRGMGPAGAAHVTMDDLAIEAEMAREDAEDGPQSSEDDEDDEEEDEEALQLFLQEEKMLVGEGDSDDDDDDSDDDGDDFASPGASFQARLDRLRKQATARESKGKGKARAQDLEDDEDEEAGMDSMFVWANSDDEEYLANIQTYLEANSVILDGRDRKSRKQLFKAIHDGDADAFGPSQQPARKKKEADIPPELRDVWSRDREKKAERKREREMQRLIDAADPLAKKKGGKKGRKAMHAAAALDSDAGLPHHVFDVASLEAEIRRFLADLGGPKTMALPPLAKEQRKKVHELGQAFGLKSVSKGKGTDRYTTLIKTTRSGIIDERKVGFLLRSTQIYVGHGRGKGPRGAPIGPPKHREGEEVGKAAPKIGAANIGYQMLAGMGWQEGERIGASAGGLEAPIAAIIKRTKLGLGATM